MKERFKHKVILLILLIFFLIKIFVLLKLSLVRWDEAVYIEMGKYIFSFGKAGLWEPARPLILPILEGFLWFVNLNPVFFGKILVLFFSVGIIYFTYLIAKELFSEKVAILSSIMVAFSPVFFFFSSFAMTGIIATFFVLVGFYFLIKKKYFLSGLFFSLGFMTRFLMLFAIISVIVLFLFRPKKEDIFRFSLGFSVFFVPYLILNYFLYGGVFYPFILQNFMTSITGFSFHKVWWYYFYWLFKENFLVYLSIIAFFLILKNKKAEKLSLISIAAVFLIFYSIIPHKEERFMVTFLPVLYILTSFSVFYLISKIKKFRNFFIGLIFLVIIINWSVQFKIDNGPDYYYYMRDYLKNPNVEGGIWISNPVYAVDSNYKIDELMYYPTFDHNKFIFLKNNLMDADNILVNTCDLGCEPYNEFCEEDKIELINSIKNKFNQVFYKKEGECESYIFIT